MGLFLTIVVLCAPFHTHNQPPAAPKHADRQQTERFHHAIVLLEALRSENGGISLLAIDNSQVVVGTPVIKGHVKQGESVIPVVLELMEVEDISFDTFTKCYSICDQILSGGKGENAVKWSGGARLDKAGQLVPRGQRFNAEFRAMVVKDIRSKVK